MNPLETIRTNAVSIHAIFLQFFIGGCTVSHGVAIVVSDHPAVVSATPSLLAVFVAAGFGCGALLKVALLAWIRSVRLADVVIIEFLSVLALEALVELV